VTSAIDARGIPDDGIPHIAFVGRSNVGKSSLLNALVKRDIARTSAAAGKTRLANLYKVTVDGGPGGPGTPGGAGRWSVYFADLPGYGYARGARRARDGSSLSKAGRESVEELRGIATAYFAGAQPIAGVLHLVDSRHPGLAADLNAAHWLQTLPVERALAATKMDKLTRAERVKNLRELERQLGMAALPLSATSGEGLDDLWTLIARLAR
jgi:GTP-binding protein